MFCLSLILLAIYVAQFVVQYVLHFKLCLRIKCMNNNDLPWRFTTCYFFLSPIGASCEWRILPNKRGNNSHHNPKPYICQDSVPRGTLHNMFARTRNLGLRGRFEPWLVESANDLFCKLCGRERWAGYLYNHGFD